MHEPIPMSDPSQWSVSQRLDLIAKLWDSLPETPAEMPVPLWHREELERRLAAADANPEAAIPWPEARDRLRRSP